MIKIISSWLGISLISLAFNTVANTTMTPSTFESIWLNDNRSRIIHNYMRMSEEQLKMSHTENPFSSYYLNLAFDGGINEVSISTDQGEKDGTIDGRSLHIANQYFGLFLEQLILNEVGEDHGNRKFTYSDYIVTGTYPGNNWNLSAGLIKTEVPLSDGNLFIAQTSGERENKSMSAFFHFNYHQLQISTYFDQEEQQSVYALASFYLAANWHNELFMIYDKNNNDEKNQRSIEWRTSLDTSSHNQWGLSVQYNLTENTMNQAVVHIEFEYMTLEYVQYTRPDEHESFTAGYNIEYFWGNRKDTSLGFGFRENFKQHQAYYVAGYPIASFFIRSSFY